MPDPESPERKADELLRLATLVADAQERRRVISEAAALRAQAQPTPHAPANRDAVILPFARKPDEG